MDRPPPSPSRTRPNVLALLAFAVAAAALFVAVRQQQQEAVSNDAETTLQRVQRSGVLRIGFEGYSPYTVQDPSTLILSGYSVDLANAIAQSAGWRVEWVKTSPDTKITDLRSNRFDVMVEPIFQTIERAKAVTFTDPYAYFGFAAGIVLTSDAQRFSRVSDLNHSDIVVAVRQGYTDETYATERLPKAIVRPLKVDDINLVFLEVLARRATVALADVAQVKAFQASHSDVVTAVFVNPPPASVPAGMMVRQGDFAFCNFLNTALRYLDANGVLDELADKHGVTDVRNKSRRG